MSKVHVKTGDTVVLLTGKYEDKFDSKGDRKTGKVVERSAPRKIRSSLREST